MSETSLSGLDPQQLRELLSVAKEPDALGSAEKDVSSGMSPRLGSWIDQYKLIERLGEGGMAIVYLAEQEYPVNRKVAIKIIKPGMNSAKVIARFEAERQTLTFLSHPNIAQIYDAGTTKDGLPYFVMEYVKGLPITEYCDNHKLTIKQRLRLFQQVCHAIQHAHQKGIIHRDIKPSNIIVSMQDDRALPKIIDFGIAKAIDQPLSERTLVTEDNQLLGTPEYMSPEQADMAAANIDTRTDVYSLGVLLYVLLAGVLPFEPEKLRDSGIENIRNTIRQTDPKTPSTRLTKLGEEAIVIAQNRRTEIRTLTGHLRRELEWIPLKAMRKERSQRYRSASELSDDIDNYLKGEPLLAGPPTAGYRLKKFIRRHKALVGGITAVLIVSVIGSVVSMYYALGQARARAESEAVSDFLQNDLLTGLSQASWDGDNIHDVLKEASAMVGTRFANQPLVEANICEKLGTLFSGAGEYKLALEQRQRANQIHLEKFDKYYNLNRLALSYNRMGQYKEAESLYMENFKRKGRLDVQGIPIPHDKFPFGCCNLAGVYINQGRYKEAEQLLKRALAAARGWGQDDHWRLYYSGTLARAYTKQGRYKEAEQLYEKILEKMRRAAGEDQQESVEIKNDFARLRLLQGNYDQAEEMLEEVIERTKSRWGSEHPRTLFCMNNLAILHTRQERYDDANALLVEVLNVRQPRLGEDHPDTLEAIHCLGVLRREQKQYAEAEDLLRQAMEGRQLKLGDDHPACFESMHEIAVLYKEQGAYDKAEPLLIEALEGRLLKLGDTHPHTIESMNSLIDLYEALHKPEKANEYRVKLPQPTPSH